jgi:hypothetical protein
MKTIRSCIVKILKRFKRQLNFFRLFFNSRKYRWIFWFKEVQPHLVSKKMNSKMPIDVVIPAIEKDLLTLPYVIDGVRKNIKHPISNIFIISPLSEKIQELCIEKNCVFINERSVIDVNPESLNIFIQGVDRSKWYYQQFLKWSGNRLLGEEHYLVVDADTVFIRPQSFEHNGKIVLNLSDEYHPPYFEIYRRILGETVKSPVSFTSHQMLFEKNKLMEIKKEIERINGCVWYEAILRNLEPDEASGHSDYDTYGQYVFSHYRKEYSLEYWFNISLKRDRLQDLDQLSTLLKDKFKSISFHSWKK